MRTSINMNKLIPFIVWERVVNLVDLNATTGKSKTTAPNAAAIANAADKNAPAVAEKKDTSRFKSMLLQLKNDATAPGNQVAAAR
jgi:hypothetical protein